MLYAYIDESGTQAGSQALCVSGVFYEERFRKHLKNRWKKELEQSGISHFHTVDQAHRNKEFAGKSREEADRIYKSAPQDCRYAREG